ncbi:MAG: DUF5717 family protein [Lachnospiraceae bacterium]|nr:DUF5717 family protein [Lachnospiraceae bacterium]
MESHIERILNGEFGYGHSTLEFPEQKLELAVYPNEDTEGVFHVLSEDKGEINGMVATSDPRMVCDNVTFLKGEAELHYIFRSKGLVAGTVIKGDISLVTEDGEYRLPFTVSVVMKFPESSQGTIKNLFHFTNLARNRFEEAVNVFYSPEMINIFQTPDRRFKNLYRSFSVYPGSAVNVEEFLVAIHKKSPVIYTLDQEKVELTEEGDLANPPEIRIRKSGWGYIRLEVSSAEPFIHLKKSVITDADFNGDIAVIQFSIDRDSLHRGKNIGQIRLKSHSSVLKIEINAGASERKLREDRKNELRRQRNISDITELYVDFRLKRTDPDTVCEKMSVICSRMTDDNDRDILPRLVMTHIYLMQGRDNDADMMLSLIGNEFMLGQIHDEAEGYYKYLKALHRKDRAYAREISRDVKALSHSMPDSPILLWLLIYLDEELENHPDQRIELLSGQFDLGVRSPFLYIELLRAMTEKSDRYRLNGLAEVYALHWGVKYDIYYDDFVTALISLSYNIKSYSPILLAVLKAYYNKTGSVELLEEICRMLIRERGERKRNSDDFRWFEAGVRYGLKITRLYECYLNTVPSDREELMPEPVLMYFSIGAGVGDDRMSLFYANLIKHKNEVPDILKDNEQRIAAFAVKEAEKNLINRDLAVIYEYVATLNIPEFSNRFLLAVGPLIFCHEISVRDKKVTMVSSVENGFVRERSGNVTNGRALITFYGGEYDLIFEYGDMHRAIGKKGIEDRILLNPVKFTKAIRFGLERDVGQAFYVCGSGRHTIQVNQVNESSIRLISSSPEIERSIRDECYFALIRYFSDHDRFEELDNILDDLDISLVSPDVRAELSRLYVSRGMHRKVYELIKEYGPEGVDPVILVRLLSRMIGEGINTEDPCLINLAWEALKRGKYDENILTYLCAEFQGTIKDLRDIWKAAHEFNVDTVKIEERILSQMLYAKSFTSDRDEILLSCIENGGRDKIIDASLAYISHEYFINKRIVDRKIFKALLKRYREYGELDDVSALSLLKYYSDFRDSDVKKQLSPLVDKLLEAGTVFDFFREYRENVPAMSLYHDRTFVEYMTDPEKKVMINYRISDDMDDVGEFRADNMDENYQGVYSSDFVLFYGEKLQYYITEENENGREPVRSELLERDVTRGGRTDSRYDMINDMLLSESVNDDLSLNDLMEQYMKLTETVEEFFE